LAHILIIDDEPLVCEMLQEILLGAGYAVTCATDGRDAQKKMRARSMDLIITDIFMPEKDGLETIEAFRRSHPKVKVIAISGGSPIRESDVLAWATRMGAAYTFQKPVDRRELLAAVDDCIGAAGPG
jgi:DNA-binding NtrC family response regulator